jgi:hypothetical protein
MRPCCTERGSKFPEWETRINPVHKQALLNDLRAESRPINSENSLLRWVSHMEIPQHIKEALQQELAAIGFHCANFDDVCRFDVPGCKQWVLEVLEQHL